MSSTLAHRQFTEIAARLDSEPGPAELLFAAYVLASAAAWLYLTWWRRW